MQRSDFNEQQFDNMFRNELIDQLTTLEFTADEPTVSEIVLITAFKKVIAYNSVPGTYEDGKYDL